MNIQGADASVASGAYVVIDAANGNGVAGTLVRLGNPREGGVVSNGVVVEYELLPGNDFLATVGTRPTSGTGYLIGQAQSEPNTGAQDIGAYASYILLK